MNVGRMQSGRKILSTKSHEKHERNDGIRLSLRVTSWMNPFYNSLHELASSLTPDRVGLRRVAAGLCEELVGLDDARDGAAQV